MGCCFFFFFVISDHSKLKNVEHFKWPWYWPRLNEGINVFKSNNCSFKFEQFAPFLLVLFFLWRFKKKDLKAAVLIEVRREMEGEKKKLSRKNPCTERELPFCRLSEKRKLGPGSVDLSRPAICQRSVSFVDRNFLIWVFL